MADERRKNKRTSMPATLVIKQMGGQSNKEVSINIVDVSKTGIGFTCDELLMIGEIYESFLTIWTKEVIHTFLQIVRVELKGEGFFYGAIFIGMSEMDSSRIAVYQTVNDPE